MWTLIRDDHLKNHSSFNEAEERLGDLYQHKMMRDMIRYCRSNCTTCDSFSRAPKGIVRAIITSRPLELVMFDLFFLPCADGEGRDICICMIDHFKKFVWGKAFSGKGTEEVVLFLQEVHDVEGNMERWHSDNGGEFISRCMKELAARLGTKHTSGRARHPKPKAWWSA
jgi:hypothetical protein